MGKTRRFWDDAPVQSRRADSQAHAGLHWGARTKMTHIYDRFSEVSRRHLPGFRFLKDMEIQGSGKKRKGPIPFGAGCIYALSSGMMSENTVSNVFARQGILENKRHGLFFVGYADPETPGGRIRKAQPGESVLLDPAHPPVPLHCEMRVFDFTAIRPVMRSPTTSSRSVRRKRFSCMVTTALSSGSVRRSNVVCRRRRSSFLCRVRSIRSEAGDVRGQARPGWMRG